MTIEELRKKYGLDQRSKEIHCAVCGAKIRVPTMYSEKVRNDVLHPFCATATILLTQWLIYHDWHVSSIEAKLPHVFYCPDCFPKGTPEYHKSAACDGWCKQAEKWMDEEK